MNFDTVAQRPINKALHLIIFCQIVRQNIPRYSRMNSNPLESSATVGSARAVQIIAPVNHEFQLDVENLKQILESDGIKDRYAVVISIAGALRKGKSFLLNFILKYLNAQVKKNK